MNNLIDIQSQIEKLQKQANDIRAREFDKTVQDIVAKMQAFRHNPQGSSRSPVPVRAKASKAGAKAKGAVPSHGAEKPRKTGPAATVAAKYRGPNGEVWSGRGLTPKWLTALIADGKTKEEFAIHR